MANCFNFIGDSVKMVRIVRQLVVKYWKNRGLSNYVKGDFAGARICFLKIKTRHRPEPGNVFNLGALMLNERKESRKALQWFQAAARFWDSPVVENNLKQARMALKKGAD